MYITKYFTSFLTVKFFLCISLGCRGFPPAFATKLIKARKMFGIFSLTIGNNRNHAQFLTMGRVSIRSSSRTENSFDLVTHQNLSINIMIFDAFMRAQKLARAHNVLYYETCMRAALQICTMQQGNINSRNVHEGPYIVITNSITNLV